MEQQSDEHDDPAEIPGPCRQCGSNNVGLVQGTAILCPGYEYFVMCFDCGAAGEPSYDFGTPDADDCELFAVTTWNAHGWVNKRPGTLALFSSQQP